MEKGLSLLLIVLMITAFVVTGCSDGSKVTTSNKSNQTKDNIKKENTKKENIGSVKIPSNIRDKELKIAVIRKIGGDDHSAQFLAGAKVEGESLGIKVDTFSANGDTAKFHDSIVQAIEKDYDGFIISHGDDDATVDYIKKISEKGKPVVAFDSNPEIAKFDGVTVTSQDDEALALLSLKKLIQDYNGKANIVYLWVDGFQPMVNRNRIYKTMLEKYPDINEVERFGVATADTSVQTQNAVSAMLAKHPKGEIDAIWATWDAFAIGAARAVKEAGRDEIKIYGIDVSNADIQEMTEEKSPWVATAAVDPKVVGATNLRILLKKIAGEETPKYYDLEASLILKDKLSEGQNINMENISNVIPEFGHSTSFEEPWMKALKESKK